MSYSMLGRGVLVVVIILCIIFRKKPWKQIFVYPLKTTEGKFWLVRSITWLLAVILTILRAFNFQRIDGSKTVELPQGNVSFLLDGSLSMSADDVDPSRFSLATDIISRIAGQSTGNAYGLIVFSGLPVIRIPRTHHISGFVTVMSGMQLGDFPPTDTFLGTALGDALLLSLQQFSQLPAQTNRAIVVISDGDSNKGYDPYKVLEVLQEQNIPVYFIAIGEEGYEVGKDATGLPVITSFDNELMEQFTDSTRGELYRNPDSDAINDLIAKLSSISDENQVIYVPQMRALNDSLAPYLLFLMSILLLFALRDVVNHRRLS